MTEMREPAIVHHAESGISYCSIHFLVSDADGKCATCSKESALRPTEGAEQRGAQAEGTGS
jgi:hypothetical protein